MDTGYKPSISVQKAAIPAMLPVIAAAVPPAAKAIGAEVDYAQSLTVLTVLYGIIKGIVNFFKNRKK
jgi:hypothetical protein